MATAEVEQNDDLTGMINALRAGVTADRRIFTDPHVKAWCARRWRFLFLNEAVKDEKALWEASTRGDKRPPRQRISERFLVTEAANAWQDEQPEPDIGAIANTTLVYCPGMLNGILPVRSFRDDLPKIETRFSMRVLRADLNPLGSCDANADDLLKAIDEGKGLDAGGKLIPESQSKPPGDMMLVSYSKGSPDTLTALVKHPQIASRVRCLFSWAGAVLGSEAANSLIAQFKSRNVIANNAKQISRTLKGIVPRRLKRDLESLRRLEEFDIASCTRDVATDVREAFMEANKDKLDGLNIPMFYIRGAARYKDVPWIQRRNFKDLCNFDKQNDMQVACNRSVLPFAMGTDLGIVCGHHWDIAYPAYVRRRWFNNMYHAFPKTAAMVAMVQLAAELGLID